MASLSVFVKKGEMYSLSLTHRYKTWYFQDLHILKIIFREWFNSSKKNHKMVTPPPLSCICEFLIQIFNRKFRDKIKMRQNSVNNHQSHPKFRCSTRLMLWTSYLSLSYTSKHPILAQNMPFWAFKFLNKSMKTSRPPPFVKVFHKTEVFFKGWLP